jgi:hypothetical protein
MGTRRMEGTHVFGLLDVKRFRIAHECEVTVRHQQGEDCWDQVTMKRGQDDLVRVTRLNDRGEQMCSEVNLKAKTVRLLSDYPPGYPFEWAAMKPLREAYRLMPAATGDLPVPPLPVP